MNKTLLSVSIPMLMLTAGTTAAAVLDNNWNYVLIAILYSIIVIALLCDDIRLRDSVQHFKDELEKTKNMWSSPRRY